MGRSGRRVPVVEVGDHRSDVVFVPLEDIDAFLGDNDEYDYALGEMGMEVGALSLNLVGASKTIQPTNASGEALFVKSGTSKPVTITSVVMKPTASATLAADQAAAKRAAEQAAAKKAAEEAAARKAAEDAAAAKKAAEAAAAAKPLNAIVNRAQEAVAAALAAAAKGGEQVASGANAINAALAASVGQTNKAPTISSTVYNAPPDTTKIGGSITLPKISVSGSVAASVKPSVAAALTAPTGNVIGKAATAIAAEAALKEVKAAVDTAQATSDAVFKPASGTATPVVIKSVVAAKPLEVSQKILDKEIKPVPVVTTKVDPGPYVVMKPSVEPLTAAKAASTKPLEIVGKVAELAPVVSALPGVQALADAAMGKAVQEAAAYKPVASLLEQLSQAGGGAEKCACIVARKKAPLAALGVQTPTLRSKLQTRTFVASPRVDFNGQVLSALRQIEQNTSSEQLRARLEKLRLATGIR